MRNSIAYLLIFRNHVRFFIRNQVAARRFDAFDENLAQPSWL
jgi:hypothetical protein